MPNPNEEIVDPAVTTAPAQVDVVAPESVVAPEPESTEPPVAKVFTQEEVDAIIGKRLAKEQRRWERTQVQQPPPPPPADVLQPTDFQTPEEYTEALAERKAQQIIAQRETSQQLAQTAEAYAEREEQAIEKYEDFEKVAYNPKLEVTDVMAQAIRAAENGPEILYQLGLDPKEAARIAKLPVFLQVKEIGRLEGKYAVAPPVVKKTTATPPPIRPINAASARTTGGPTFDTTDPRSIESMTTSQWIEAERQRQIRKAQGQRTH